MGANSPPEGVTIQYRTVSNVIIEMNSIKCRILCLVILTLVVSEGCLDCGLLRAQERKVMNRPYIDTRIWHYGFLFGLHFQDQDIACNGLIYDNDGTPESWYADVARYSPGFSVGVLGELRLNEYLSLRVVPTMHFGDKTVVYRDIRSGSQTSQVMKSTYISVPVDLKLSAPRFNNFRPYIMAGVSPFVDLTVKEQRELLVRRADCMIEFGLGMDLYFRYFKLIPELKFCFGLSDVFVGDRSDLTDASLLKFTESVNSIRNRMIVLTFYFE